MAITVFGAFRSNTTLSDGAVTFATPGTTFQISSYSQITFSDGADGSVIDGDDVVNETPNDPTQTYLGNAIDWDYTIQVNNGFNNYDIAVLDWDANGDGDFDYPTGEQGFFLAFIGAVPPLNTTLTIGPIVDNGASIPVDSVVPCFTAGTLIETPDGSKAIENLAKGDLVLTADHGPQPIRWIGSRTVTSAELQAKPRLRPICVSAGALGAGLPRRDLRVSPQHRMLVRSAIAVRMFDAQEVLVPAHKLVGVPGIFVDETANSATYYHILFDRHQIVTAEGAPTESLFTGPEALKSVGPDARREIFELFPELGIPDHVPAAARPIPKSGKRARHMIHRHVKNDQPLITHA